MRASQKSFQKIAKKLPTRRAISLMALLAHAAMVVVAAPLFPPEPGLVANSPEHKLSTAQDFGISPDEIQATWLENHNFAREDAREYALMASGELSYPPYSLRPLVPTLVGLTSHLFSGPNDPAAFLNNLYLSVYLWNFVFVAGAGLFTFLAVTKLSGDPLIGMGFGAVAIANVGTIQTATFLMTDPASYFFAALTLYLVVRKRPLIAGLALGVGVLAKEILIVFILLFVISFISGQKWKSMAAAVMATLSFVAIRIANGQDPLSVQYGWNVSQGDIRFDYFLLHADDPQRFLFRTLIALAGPLVVAALYIGHTHLPIALVMWGGTGLVVVANLFLASGVTRVLQIALTFLRLSPWAIRNWHTGQGSAKTTKSPSPQRTREESTTSAD